MQKPNVFNFSDYRSFLKTYAHERKSSQAQWALATWARKLGLGATTSLTMVLNGQREPGKEMLSKLVTYFKFAEKEKAYFESLVKLSKYNDDPKVKALLMEHLASLSPQKNFALLDSKTFEIISKVLYYTLRQMVMLPHFCEDPAKIKSLLRFQATEGQIAKALTTLEEVGLFERQGERLVRTNIKTTTQNDVASEAVRRFHKEAIELGLNALDEVDVVEREFQTLTLNIKLSDIPKAKELIRNFKIKFDQEIETQAGDSTYLFSMQLFPLTKNPEIKNVKNKERKSENN